MARLRTLVAPALLAGALAGCGGGSAPAPEAAQPVSAAAPDDPAPPENPVSPEDPASAAGEEPAQADAEEPEQVAKPVAVTELRGRFGFDSLHPESTRCRALDKAFVAKLEKAGATCQEREPGESFGVDGGPWHSCITGEQEWLIFATRKICVEMYETMMANAE